MEQEACGQKRNSYSGEDGGPAFPVNKRIQGFAVNSRENRGEALLDANKRMQGSLVITGPDGKVMTRDGHGESVGPQSASSKFDTTGVKQQHLRRRTCDIDVMLKNHRKATSSLSQPIIHQPAFSTPQPLRKSGLSHTTHTHQPQTPSRLPKTPAGFDYLFTPKTQSSKARPPMSSNRKTRSRAAAMLRILDDQELQASRLLQARQDLLMDRQERAYVAWLNHILDRPVTGGSWTSSYEDFGSRNFSATPPSLSRNSAYEVYWDEDCVPVSPRDPICPSRSPRTPLVPLNGLSNRGFGSPAVTDARNPKRSLKDVFSTPDRKTFSGQSTTATPHLSSKRLKMITEHGVSYPRDVHMQDVCRMSELARRLKLHFNQSEREEILTVTTQVAKHIDEGRLRMKKGCAILADVALRKKALHVLLNYSAYWMRIGLHVVLGHTALLKERIKEDDSKPNDCKDAAFALLEVFLEKHFFAHPGLAKKYATNKTIEGLYRDGYSEALGRVILKRFFLLVLVLDKAKGQAKMKIADEIDRVNVRLPPLFRSDARVTSSRQALQEFLSDVMHGEGDVVGNLSALGYHVHHYQASLADYDFAVVDLIEDLRDGIRLCRLVQLLTANDTFFLEHVQVPSNGRKRQLHNCHIALESLAQAGVPLEDEDGSSITAEDIVGGNRDKLFPLLWNIMVHLQIPLLVSRPRLCQEIAKLQGTEGGVSLGLNIGTVELLLKWTQVTCMIAGNLNVRNFKTSFADGQALCLIVNLYWPVQLPQNALLRPPSSDLEEHAKALVVNTPDVKVDFTSAYKNLVAHNFGLVQGVARELGSIPEVLQLVDLLGDPGMSERNIIIFVAFFCSQLLKDKPPDLNRIRQDAAANHRLGELLRCSSQCNLESESPSGFSRSYAVPWPQHEALCGPVQPQGFGKTPMNEVSPRIFSEAILVKICRIQAWWRGLLARRQILIRHRKAQKLQMELVRFPADLRRRGVSALILQAHFRGYLARRMLKAWAAAATVIQVRYRAHVHRNQEREQAAHVLQYYFRAWAQKRRYLATVSSMCQIQALWWAHEARGNFLKERQAVRKIETEWQHYVARRKFHVAQTQWKMSQSAQMIQAHWRGYTTRKILITKATHLRRTAAACLIQCYHRGLLQRRSFTEIRIAAVAIQAHYRAFTHRRLYKLTKLRICQIQSSWRARRVRRQFLEERQATRKIQSAWRHHRTQKRHESAATLLRAAWLSRSCRRKFQKWKAAAILIQCCYRGHIQRQQCLRYVEAASFVQDRVRGWVQRRAFRATILKICKLQGMWRGNTVRRQYRRSRSAVEKIQKAWRRFLAQKRLKDACVVRIQSMWRAYSLKQRDLQWAATLIQKQYRAYMHRRGSKTYEDAVVRCQAFWRGKLARRRTQVCQAGVTRIQAAVRGMIQRFRLSKQRTAATRIQSVFRAWHHNKVSFQDRQASLLCLRSAMIIQAAWKKHCANKLSRQLAQDCPLYVQTLVESAGTISQTPHMEVCNCSSSSKVQLWASVTIQTWWRDHLSRKDVGLEKENMYRVGNIIQSHSEVDNSLVQRSSLGRQKYSPQGLKAAHLMLSWLRTFVQRAHHLRLRQSTILIQRHIRGWIHRSSFVRMKNSAILIQAHWRGYAIRRDQSPMQDPLGDLRQRMQSTAATVQDKERLCNRLTEALSLLLCQKTVSGILSTCRTIDIATQYSLHCCEQLEKVGAITRILHLIQTINRSPPLEQVLKHALSVLNNLARYPPLATRVAQAPSAISIIGEQLHTFRNSEDIFAQAISVLQIVCKTSAGMEVLQRERPLFRRLQLIAQSLEQKVQVKKRNLEKPPWATSATSERKSAQKKISEANCQFLSAVALVKDIDKLFHYQTSAFATPRHLRHPRVSNPKQSTCYLGSSSVGPKLQSTSGRANLRRITDVSFHDRSDASFPTQGKD